MSDNTYQPAKLPPHDIEAEEAVIASLLVDVDGTIIAAVAPILQGPDFYRQKNGWIFQTCISLWERNETINEVMVGHELARRDRLEEIGGLAYLSRLVTELPTPIGAEHYARIVKRDAIYRAILCETKRLEGVANAGNGALAALFEDWSQTGENLRAAAMPVLGRANRCAVIEGVAFSEPVGEAPHAVDGIAPRPGFTLFAGVGESFKSWIAVEAALSVAAGTTFLGRFPVEQGPSVVFDQQVDDGEVKRRCQKLAAGGARDLTTLPFAAVVDAGLNLNNASDVAAVIDIINERGAIFAVFDAAADFFAGMDLMSDREVRLATDTFKRIGRETGAAILAIHHWRKSSKEGSNTPEERLFGSVYWRNNSDSYLALQLHGVDRVLAVHGKARRRTRLDPFLIVCDGAQDDPHLRLRYAGEAGESVDKQDAAEGWVLRTLAESGPMKRPELLGAAESAKVASKRTIENALGSLVGSGLVDKASKPGEPHGVMYYWLEGEAPAWTATEPLL